MTAQGSVAAPPAGAGLRARPAVHFTPAEGWINDPTGLVWTGDRYHLYYQAVPGSVTWAPQCRWGHAESTDLVHWTERPLALTPQPFELGCWSGRVVPDAPEGARLFYTRINEPDWGAGAIAVAVGDAALGSWVSGAEDVVIPGPPPGLAVTTYRDPFVFRHEDEWVMIVGAGLADGSGAAVHYRSPDLAHWTCDGLLAERRSSPADEVWTGSGWECPQLVRLDAGWVLIVSVWHADELHYVAAALGEYDGRRFVPRQWQRLTHGDSAYAMSAFTDRDGRAGVISWLREEPRNDPGLVGWAGAHSAPALLHRNGSRLTLEPHPDVVAAAEPVDRSRDGVLNGAGLVTYVPTPGRNLVIRADGRVLAELRPDAESTTLQVDRGARGSARLPLIAEREIRVLVDADIVEVFGPGGYGAYRIGPLGDGEPLELAWTHGPSPTP